jgi:AraC family transcriptional regulator, alkane utilization regulator
MSSAALKADVLSDVLRAVRSPARCFSTSSSASRGRSTGWLARLRDTIVGQALAILHGEPRASWTVERLARSVGVSRSVLAERFTAMLGTPPMQYLAMWRMQLASHLLVRGDSVAAVASGVGYESEAAFSRAFKKFVGQPPATWRKQSYAG